jgi:hypothetical protein
MRGLETDAPRLEEVPHGPERLRVDARDEDAGEARQSGSAQRTRAAAVARRGVLRLRRAALERCGDERTECLRARREDGAVRGERRRA